MHNQDVLELKGEELLLLHDKIQQIRCQNGSRAVKRLRIPKTLCEIVMSSLLQNQQKFLLLNMRLRDDIHQGDETSVLSRRDDFLYCEW